MGRRTNHGKIEVLGIGKAESAGVTRGVVSNIQKTELEINKQESENQSLNQHHSLQDTEQQAIDLDYILETLQTKINQEYRRFYGG
mgnify:CR=1 FL=1